jgi:hypothetical protein
MQVGHKNLKAKVPGSAQFRSPELQNGPWYLSFNFKRTVSRDGMDIFYSLKINQWFPCMSWWFSRSSKITYLFWKYLLQPWLVVVLQSRPLIGCRENAQELICYRRLPGYFYRITGGFCKHFQCQNSCFKVFEAGYWKDFQN